MSDSKDKKTGFSTLCVHGGEVENDAQGAIHTPLYNHSTFGFESTAEIIDVVQGRKSRSLYTRYGFNPTIEAAERKMAALEGGEAAFVFASGMAAEAAVMLAFCGAGERLVCIGDVYGGTYKLLVNNFPKLGINVDFLPGSKIEGLEGLIGDRTRMVFFETPTNPTMEILDIERIAGICRNKGAICVVDNTFASPYNQNPLALGADIVVHSATKYLGGHSDITGGVVIGSRTLLEPIWDWRKSLGSIMAPDVAFLLLRSLRTLSVRVAAQNQRAQIIAAFLNNHPKVRKVSYPGLPDHPGYDVASRQMRGFGGMISFDYDGDMDTTAAMVDKLELFSIAASLGGVESLVTQPVTTTHHGLSEEERAARGITDSLVRLSIGLEEAEDLLHDLEQAME